MINEEKMLDSIIKKVEKYLIEVMDTEGFADEKDGANRMEVDEVPSFISELKNEGIIPEEMHDCYVQFTIDNHESPYVDMATKFVVFDYKGNFRGYVPFERVIRESDSGYYEGLKREGVRELIKLMLPQ